MKLAKLSLVAAVLGCASSSFAADTLAQAFQEGSVSGELKAYYWMRDRSEPSTGSESIFTTGVTLNYKTAPLKGFFLNFTGQSSSSPFASDEAKSAFGWDEYGSGAVLSEASLNYQVANTTLSVGRMYMNTVLVASIGNRVIKESFEGAQITNKDIPNTTLTAAYITKFQAQTDNDGGVGKFVKAYANYIQGNTLLTDGAYVISAVNNSIAGLTLRGEFARDIGLSGNMIYANAIYAAKAGDLPYALEAQYYYNNKNMTGTDSSSDLLGLRGSLTFGDVTGKLAYTTVSEDGSVNPGYGWGADYAYTTSNVISTVYRANTDAYAIGLDYVITPAMNVSATYIMTDDDEVTYGKANYTSLSANYAFNGSLKGLSIGFVADFESRDKDGANDKDEMRFNANYKF